MMVFFIDFYSAIQDFVETGGQVLLVIGILIFVMWLMILERVFYYSRGHQQEKRRVLQKWQSRDDKSSWHAEQIRQAMISRVSLALGGKVPVLQALVALCPLLGLMGTVTGMIEVFDVMAFLGNGSPKAMASGISKATIPTMAGMVGALTGVFAQSLLERFIKREKIRLEDQLTFDH